jgi:hypothetical protein|tara:strand:+ start:127 stop:420 length:294 start_codon:yes stop_codon:yes gene_type:complete
MIIEAPYKVGDTVSIKLASGEEMLTNLVAEDATNVTISKPLMVIATETGIGLAPFMFTVSPDSKLKIRLNSIICIAKSAKDATDSYIKQTSGIVIAT